MSDERDEQSRSETSPFDRGSSSGQPGSWSGAPSSDQPAQPPYDQGPYTQPQYDQPQYDQAQYTQPQYDQSQYTQPSYGQQYGQQYGQPADVGPYGQQYGQSYGQPAGYGQQYGTPALYGQQQYGYGPADPAKPGGVITAAVLGFVFGALGVLVTAGLLVFGAVVIGAGTSGSADELNDLVPGFSGVIGAFAGILVVIGLLALVWTVLIIWGSVWALTGRSRVLLLVAGSFSILTTGIGLVGNLSDSGGAGNVVVWLLFFAAAVAIVVLLSLQPASQFFAAHRARRAG